MLYETRCKTGRTNAKVRATKSHRIFRNEGSRSTPYDPKLTFWCVRTIWVHLGLFGCLTKLDAKRAEQVQKFIPRSHVRIFRNKSTRYAPLDPKLTFWCVSNYFGAFRTIWLPSKLGTKQAELVPKFMPGCRVRFFATKTPDPPHWTLN